MALDIEISPKSSSEGPRGPAEELLIEYSDSTDFESVDAGRRQRTPSELKQGECNVKQPYSIFGLCVYNLSVHKYNVILMFSHIWPNQN